MQPQPFGVAGAIIEREGKFLLVQEVQKHIPNHPDHGKWHHPAGKIEVGEDPLIAARREVEEETGYQFVPTHLLGVYSIVRRRIHTVLGYTPHALKFIYIGTIDNSQSVLSDDVSRTQWFSQQEIESMDASQLRDIDIKKMIRDYSARIRFPLSVATHTEE